MITAEVCKWIRSQREQIDEERAVVLIGRDVPAPEAHVVEVFGELCEVG